MQTILDLQTLDSHLARVPLSALLGIESVYCTVQPGQPLCLPFPGEHAELPAEVSEMDDVPEAERSQKMPKLPGPDSVTTREQVRG